jgi:ABC-type transporter Mla subunit MlaD
VSGLQARIVAAILIVAAVLVVVTNKSPHVVRTYQVRAIFDNAAFAVPGEDVRIAGAPIGSIKSLDVTPDKRAAVTLNISYRGFTPFHADAHCSIRPQSLIGERYVDCTPGSSSTPALARITSGAGAGTYLLPITRTSSPVDSDIVQSIYREPIRQRFALIINELGTGLAARGTDLNTVIHRANPALGNTDQVLKILAKQNHQLAQLATDSDTVLAPLARARNQLSGFITQANATSVASASRAAAISESFRLFPSFLRQLRPLLVDLGNLSDQGTPLMASLRQSAAALGRQFQNLAPFARAARPALINLGASSHKSQPALLATIPLAKRLRNLGNQANPAGALLQRLTTSLDRTGAIEQLMSLLFYGTSAANGFDSLGHYVRVEPMVGSCTAYIKKPVPGCSANFSANAGAASAIQASAVKAVRASAGAAPRSSSWAGAAPSHAADTLNGLLRYLIGGGR